MYITRLVEVENIFYHVKKGLTFAGRRLETCTLVTSPKIAQAKVVGSLVLRVSNHTVSSFENSYGLSVVCQSTGSSIKIISCAATAEF